MASDDLKGVKDIAKQFLTESATGERGNLGGYTDSLLPNSPRSEHGGSRTDVEGSQGEDGDSEGPSPTGRGFDYDNQGSNTGNGRTAERENSRNGVSSAGSEGIERVGSGSSEAEYSMGEGSTGPIRDEGIPGHGQPREQDSRSVHEALSRLPEIGIIDPESNEHQLFANNERDVLTHLETFHDAQLVEDSQDVAHVTETKKPTTKGKKGRPKGKPGRPPSKGKTTSKKDAIDELVEEAAEVSPLTIDDSPLSEEEWHIFTDTLVLVSEIMDDLEGYTGLETDPAFGGVPIWRLEQFEAEAITKSYRVLAKSRKQLNRVARTVNMLGTHAEAGIIVGSRVIMSVTRHISEGFHFRLTQHRREIESHGSGN